MIKNLISLITPTQQATTNGASSEEGSVSQKGVFGALMKALGTSSNGEQQVSIQLAGNEMGQDQGGMSSDLTGDGTQFTVVVEKRSSNKEQNLEIENEQVVDSANVEGEPAFAPLVQNEEEGSEEQTSEILMTNEVTQPPQNSTTEPEMAGEVAVVAAPEEITISEVSNHTTGNREEATSVEGEKRVSKNGQTDQKLSAVSEESKPVAHEKIVVAIGEADRLIEENVEAVVKNISTDEKVISTELPKNKGVTEEPGQFVKEEQSSANKVNVAAENDETTRVVQAGKNEVAIPSESTVTPKTDEPVISEKELASSAKPSGQEIEKKEPVDRSESRNLSNAPKETIQPVSEQSNQTNAADLVSESTPEIQKTKESVSPYEPILPVKQKVQEVPVEEEVARELQKHERSVLSLRRNGHILRSSSELSAHGQKAKADFEDFIQPWQEVVTKGAVVSQQGSTTEQTSPNGFPNAIDFEKRPELLHLFQNIKMDEPKAKPAKEVKFEETKEGKEVRTELASDTERMELNLTRKEGAGFLVHTSSEGEYFNFDASLTLSTEQEEMLKEYMTDSIEGKDEKKVDLNMLGHVRLGDLPVMNQQVRRALVSTVGKMVHQSVDAKNNSGSTSWQKHTFELEDGNSIDVTTRNVDGVLQIKLAATNPELNKLLQDASNDIRQHLEKELDMQLDLQFNGQDQQDQAEFGNDAKKSAKGFNTLNSGDLQEVTGDAHINQTNTHTVRHFGYNQMEWTA